jgi:tartrate-resistant acid phosphatase type 5
MVKPRMKLLKHLCIALVVMLIYVQPYILIAQTDEPARAEILDVPTATDEVRFAVIGDYGKAGPNAEAVAEMVIGWEPDFILTTGDNNYDVGAAETIDQNIGQYYHTFIAPYVGEYGEGAGDTMDDNRFFPTLGNHDWLTDDAEPYFDYFELPGNERYYTFTSGDVQFFALDSDYNEPDGIRSNSLQAEWLQDALTNSTATWKIIYFHVAPYSSGHQGSSLIMQWPFAEWGADAVISGHDHIYERLEINGIPYFINGVGGGAIYAIETPLPESEFRYNFNYGAMLVTASERELTFEFYSIADADNSLDSHTLTPMLEAQ